LLEEALQRFADSPEILLEAMEVALAGNAFKKAVGYGKLVLKHDPINPRVRSSLGSAHMAHARKKIRNGKYDAARLELEQADEWLRSSADRGRLKVLGGLLEQGDGRLSEAQRLIREGIAELGGELVGQFHVSLEAKRLFHDPAKTLKALGVKPPKSLAAAEVLNLVRVFDTQRIEYGLLWAALTPFAPVLRKAASLAFSEQEHLLICEVLSRLDLRELLLGYAKAARQQHPKCPVFVCHDVAARYGERPWAMPDRDFDDLERALTEASQSGDMRTVLRIQDLLGAASSPFAEAPDDEEFPEDELALVGGDVRVQLEELIRLVGEKKFLEMIRKGLGKKAFGELERSAGRNNLLDVVLDLLIQVGPPPGFGMPPIMPFPGPIESRSAKPRKPSKPQRPKPSPGETPIMPTQRDLFDD
jgi:tetratricopeptide (TPR) repeat protein